MNDLDLCLEVMSSIVLHSTLNISETIRDSGLVPKDNWQEMAYGLSNDQWRHVTLKGQTPDPSTLRVQYLKNSWI